MLSKSSLIGKLTVDATQYDILGSMCWWNIKNVDIGLSSFKSMLESVGLSADYAKEHNRRSSLTRAMRTLEEQRIIRMVQEDEIFATYQFTKEVKIEHDEDPSLEYTKETMVVFDKANYDKYGDINKAITKCDETIKPILIEAFNKARVGFNSSDVTRCIHRIFTDNGDIVGLRDKGAIYFVPAAFADLMDKVGKLVNNLGNGSSFDSVPLIDVASSRTVIGNALSDELDSILKNMDDDINKLKDSSKTITKQWADHRLAAIAKIQDRMLFYAGVLNNSDEFQTKIGEISRKLII